MLRSAHTLCLCLLGGSENKQRLFPYTALTDCFFYNRDCVYCAVRTERLTIIKSNRRYAADRILVLYKLHEILTVEKRQKSDNRNQKVPAVLAQHQSSRTRLSPAGVHDWWPNYHCTTTALLMCLSAVAICYLQPARPFSQRASVYIWVRTCYVTGTSRCRDSVDWPRHHVTYQQVMLRYGPVRAMWVFGQSMGVVRLRLATYGRYMRIAVRSSRLVWKTGGSVQSCVFLAPFGHGVLETERARYKVVECIEGYKRNNNNMEPTAPVMIRDEG